MFATEGTQSKKKNSHFPSSGSEGWSMMRINLLCKRQTTVSLREPFEKETPCIARKYQLVTAGSFIMEEISDEKSGSCLSAIKKGSF